MRLPQYLLFITLLLLITACGSAKRAQQRQVKVDAIIRTAKSFIGVPYRWGGTTRAGMDCSGLLINSYSAINFQLPRTSAAQSKVGKKVNMGKLQPGDLVFFATGKKRRRVTHVGMVTYVGRDKIKFIHSSTSLGVVESDLNSNYYRKRFITGRRPF